MSLLGTGSGNPGMIASNPYDPGEEEQWKRTKAEVTAREAEKKRQKEEKAANVKAVKHASKEDASATFDGEGQTYDPASDGVTDVGDGSEKKSHGMGLFKKVFRRSPKEDAIVR